MNKIIVVICIFTIAFISFTVGYKYGDSNGYDAGYTEGYRYDCREEIGNLYEQVKATKKAVEFTDRQLKILAHENDSLKNPAYAQQRYADSIAERKKFTEDSLKNWKIAKRKNDSLAKHIGYNSNIYTDDGRFNPMACISPEIEKKVAECAKHKNFIHMFRKQPEF